MNNTDQNIRKILVENEEGYAVDSELENSIMKVIGKQKDYKEILSKTKLKIKIGLLTSLILFFIYVILTYTDLLRSIDLNTQNLKTFYPSIFAAIVVVIVYFQMIFGISVLKKDIQV
ncbi:hypothetical protein [uncultured Aquimarina sp.]|uniref:hypothetical protein n=1 Tax=uncultured Aquimarina sp. TaxID=575652 RepID=UPI0026351D90|nr:hypothetical protein [uncultured Aquimarina sp.]